LITFDPAIGWKPKENLDTHYLAERDDIFHIRTNFEGWPGKLSLDESQIVVFGDSFAFGYGIDTKASFAEIHPHLSIKAIAAPGYTMVQELLLMRQLSSQLHGRLVVWFIYLENDLYDNLMPNLRHYRAPFVRSPNAQSTWEIVTSHLSPRKWDHAPPRRPYHSFLAQLCTPCPLSQHAYAACRFLIEEGHHACSQAGAQLVVMTIPDLRQLSQRGREYLSSLGVDAELYDANFPDQQIAEICRQSGVPFIAAKDYLSAQDYKAHEKIHWNERGHRRVAKILSCLHEAHLLGELQNVVDCRHLEIFRSQMGFRNGGTMQVK
jgi:hypothetical protein